MKEALTRLSAIVVFFVTPFWPVFCALTRYAAQRDARWRWARVVFLAMVGLSGAVVAGTFILWSCTAKEMLGAGFVVVSILMFSIFVGVWITIGYRRPLTLSSGIVYSVLYVLYVAAYVLGWVKTALWFLLGMLVFCLLLSMLRSFVLIRRVTRRAAHSQPVELPVEYGWLARIFDSLSGSP